MSAADMSRENWPMRAYSAEASATAWKWQALICYGLVGLMAVALVAVAGQRDEAYAERARAVDVAADAVGTLEDVHSEYQRCTRDLDVCQTYVLWSNP